MNTQLDEILKSSTFMIRSGSWVYAKVTGQPKLEDCFMLSRDEDEVTAIFEKHKADSFELLEQNKDLRVLIEVRVSKPFYAIGFLAALTTANTAKGCSNLLVSTYSKDYLLVLETDIDTVKQTLLELGLQEQSS